MHDFGCIVNSSGLDKAIGCFDAAVQVCFNPPNIIYMIFRFFCKSVFILKGGGGFFVSQQ